jgi:hypothetical protein
MLYLPQKTLTANNNNISSIKNLKSTSKKATLSLESTTVKGAAEGDEDGTDKRKTNM